MVVSNDAEYGAVVSVPIVVHAPPPDGARSKSTWSTPEPPLSAAEPVSTFVSLRYAPGSSWLVVGGVLSMRTFVTAAEACTLPATSVTTMRSW